MMSYKLRQKLLLMAMPVMMVGLTMTGAAYAQSVEVGVNDTGAVKLGDANVNCDGTMLGSIRYNSASGGSIYFCNGTTWANVSSTGGGSISALTAAAAINTIDNTLFAQTWNWSTLSTQTALAMNANAITSGKVLNLASTATGFTGTMADLVLSGSNAANTGTVLKSSITGALSTGTPLMVTNLGAGLSMRVNDATGDADTTPFIVDAGGNVGVGTGTATYDLSFGGASNRTIGLESNAGAGGDLTVRAGTATSGVSAGGNLNLLAGTESTTGTPGIVDIQSGLRLSNDVTSASLGTSQDDYVPTNGGRAAVYRLTASTPVNITGLAGGSDGRILTLMNFGSNAITLIDESPSSTATNRLALTQNLTLAADQSTVMIYDSTSGRWRVFGADGLGVASGSIFSGLTAANAINSINNLNFAQTWSWNTLTTESALSLGSTSITSGKVLFVSSGSVGMTGTMADFTLSGNNAANTGTVLKSSITGAASTGTPLMVTNLGAGLSMRVNDATGDADTTPFVVDAAGSVGIGTGAPLVKLEVREDANAYTGAIVRNNTNGTAALAYTGVASATSEGGLVAYPAGYTVEPNFQDRLLLYAPDAATTPLGTEASGIDIIAGATTGTIRLFSGGDDVANERMRLTAAGLLGVGVTVPDTRLHVAGTLKIADGGENCTVTANGGMIRYTSTNTLQFCNGTTWTSTASGTGLIAIDDLTDAVTDYATNFNLFMGQNAGNNPIAGSQYNTAIGQDAFDAVKTNAADGNTALGYFALTGLTAGNYNTAVGMEALSSVTSGAENTAIGRRALYGSTGSFNIGIGPYAGTETGTGSYNIGIGPSTLGGTGNKSYNIAVGSGAGSAVTTGSNNLLLGYSTAGNLTSGSYNIILGDNINALSATANNQLNIGNTIYGDMANSFITIGGSSAPVSKFIVSPPASETIFATTTITANACGTIKQIDAGGSVTTSTTNTFTAPTAAYAGCCMDVINVDTVDTITLDQNANFITGNGSDVALAPTKSVRVCTNGTTWYQDAPTSAVTAGAVPLSGITAATSTPTALANSTFTQTWNWALTAAAADAFTFGEGTAATGGAGDQSILKTNTLAASTAIPLMVTNLGNGLSMRVNDATGDTDTTPFIVDAGGNVGVGTGTATYDLSFGGAAARTIGVESNAGVGADLTVRAGAATSGASNGGNLNLLAGTENSTGTAGIVDIQSGLRLSNDVTSASLGASQDNYVPTNGGRAAVYRLTASTPVSITGLAGGSDGRIITLMNVGSNTITLTDEGPSSTAINRFALTQNLSLAADQSTVLIYDSTATRWRVFGADGLGGGGSIDGLTDGVTDYATDFNVFMGQNAGAGIVAGAQYNTAIGQNSFGVGVKTANADMNTALGQSTLYANTSGGENTAIGAFALDSVTSGDTNTAVGADALTNVQTGIQNTAVGRRALYDTTGGFNVGIGPQAAGAVGAGNGNIGIGANTLNATGDKSNNTAVGVQAGNALTTGSNNTLIGNSVGDAISTGSNNVVLGYDIDPFSNTASNQLNIGGTIYGDLANDFITLGGAVAPVSRFIVSPPATETIAGAATITANSCGTIKQIQSTGNVTTNTTNTFTTPAAAYAGCCMDVINVDTADTITLSNNANFFSASGINIPLLPNDSVRVCTNGTRWYQVEDKVAGVAGGTLDALSDAKTDYANYNMFLGQNSGNAIAAGGTDNIGIGTDALLNVTTGDFNTAMGDSALRAVTTGLGNTAFGRATLSSTTGDHNTAVGNTALEFTVGGVSNTAVGHAAMQSNTSGNRNVSIGYGAGYGNLLGNDNINLGFQAGDNITDGDFNIMIGSDVLAPSPTGDGQLNIGDIIFGDMNNNRVRIGGTGAVGAFNDLEVAGTLAVKVSSGTVAQRPGTPAAGMIRYCTSGGTCAGGANGFEVYKAAWTDMGAAQSSDIRLKTNIVELNGNDILNKLSKVKNYSFEYKDALGAEHYGVMAQEFEKIFPELVYSPPNDGYKSVRYMETTALLMEASKQLKVENDLLKSQISSLEDRLASIEGDMKGMKVHTGYGVNKAMIGFGMLFAIGLSLLTFAGVALFWRRKVQ